MPVRVRLLLLLASLSVAAVALLATHCEGYPDCGHVEGAACPSSACVYLPLPGSGSPLICAGGNGGGGGGGGPTPTPTPDPVPKEFWMWNGGEYSYDAGCADGDRIDPVTTVIRIWGSTAAEHFAHHTLDVGADTQHYRDGGGCVEGEISLATNDGNTFCPYPCAESRWHVRCNINSTADPWSGTWAGCTPHWDQADGFLPCWHWVPAVFGDRWPGLNPLGSGFDAGRDYLYHLMVVEGDHLFMGSEYWGNRHEMEQCAGEDVPPDLDDPDTTGSDGWVNYIRG